jgi:hypothetical protein
MKKVSFKIFHSYEEAQKDLDKEVFSLSPRERVSITEHLRRQYFLIKNKPIDLKVKKVLTILKG